MRIVVQAVRKGQNKEREKGHSRCSMETGMRVVRLRQVKQWRPVMAGGCVGHAPGMVIVSTTREWGEGENQRQRNKEITEVHLEWLMC
jgi:hypothetical protein